MCYYYYIYDDRGRDRKKDAGNGFYLSLSTSTPFFYVLFPLLLLSTPSWL